MSKNNSQMKKINLVKLKAFIELSVKRHLMRVRHFNKFSATSKYAVDTFILEVLAIPGINTIPVVSRHLVVTWMRGDINILENLVTVVSSQINRTHYCHLKVSALW